MDGRDVAAAAAAHRAGDRGRAHDLCVQVLAADPQAADALDLLGCLAQEAGDLPAARRSIEASIRARPAVAATHYNLGVVCALLDDVAAAIAAYRAAVDLCPGFAEAHANLGNVYRRARRSGDALRAYAAAIGAQPDFAPAYVNLATVLIELERYDDAIRALETAVRIAPDLPEAHANLGQAYRRSGRFRAATIASARALERRPGYCEAYLNLALAACDLDDLPLALAANDEALARHPTSADVHCNRARVFFGCGRHAEAVAAAEAAIALRPHYAQAHVNLALALLALGDFARGFDEYVWMWRVPTRRAQYPYLDRVPLWNGEPFAGRRLLITRDQGFGDAIQMARYFPAVKALGGEVIVEALPPLLSLLRGHDGIDELRAAADAPVIDPAIDLHVPLLGLPRALRTTADAIPAPIPYLDAPAELVARWRPRMARPGRLRVGLVWSGNAGHATDHHRSLPFEELAPLAALAGIAWFALDKGPQAASRSCGALVLEPLGPQIRDFGDTAAILTQLDLVIAVDTAVAHLAGALGRPVWTLLAFAPDWRWRTGRSDSPWYPSMRLVRQPAPGAWAPVIAEVGAHLRDVQLAGGVSEWRSRSLRD